MVYFTIVLKQVMIFVIYAMIGVVGVKLKFIREEALPLISKLVTSILLPLLIFTNTINSADRSQFLAALPVFGIYGFLFFLVFILSGFMANTFRLTGDRRGVFRAGAIFGNLGFMGIPIIGALFPKNGLLYVAMVTMVDQLLLWTVGTNLTMSVEHAGTITIRDRLRKILNPATVCLIASAIVILFRIPVPDMLNHSLTSVGQCATPMALMYIGANFCFIDIRESLSHIEFYGDVIIKMILFPLAFTAVIRMFPGVSEELAVTMGVLSAMPCFSALAMMAQNEGSPVDYATGLIFTTTVCSIVTLPLLCWLLGLGWSLPPLNGTFHPEYGVLIALVLIFAGAYVLTRRRMQASLRSVQAENRRDR